MDDLHLAVLDQLSVNLVRGNRGRLSQSRPLINKKVPGRWLHQPGPAVELLEIRINVEKFIAYGFRAIALI